MRVSMRPSQRGPRRCAVATALVLLALTTAQSHAQSSNPESPFTNVLTNLVNDILGVQQYQNYLDWLKASSQQTSTTPNGTTLVASIAAGIQSSIAGYVSALTALNNAVFNAYEAEATASVSACCNINTVQTDARFEYEVDVSQACFITENSTSTSFFSAAILSTMQANLANTPTLKWQYFGGSDGSSFFYPASNQCNPTYDPRLRPWYYGTSSAMDKDIVILIDVSSSMGNAFGQTASTTNLQVAINTANAIVETLTTNDRVAVVAFAQSITYPTSNVCFASSLALVTPQNKQNLVQFIDKLTTRQENATYVTALNAAFALFTSSNIGTPASPNRPRVVMLLTNGNGVDAYSDVYRLIQTQNAAMNNSLVFVTFGITQSIPTAQATFLQNVAEQTFPNITSVVGAPQVGSYIQINDASASNIMLQIGVYYNLFLNSGNSVHFTVPYNDSLGLGLLTTACLPVIFHASLIGVTCVDISLDLLLNNLINFQLGQFSYAFAIDGHGRTLLHPLLPPPEAYVSAYAGDAIIVEISSLETSPGIGQITNSMMSGATGSMSIEANLEWNLGSSQLWGVQSVVQPATYYWQPIPVMNVSICLVIVDNEVNNTDITNGTYYYVLLNQQFNETSSVNPTKCVQWTLTATTETSMIQLASIAFVDPFNYSLVYGGPGPEITRLQQYLEGKAPDAGPLTVMPGVREVVANTYILDSIWKAVNSSFCSDTLYRYYGSANGVFRKYPGTLMPKEYDPTKRPWYITAIGADQKNKITVTAPYEDVSGVMLLTVCHTILDGSTTAHTDSDPINGVFGVDITLASFYSLLTTEFAPCASSTCFAIDNGGFVIVHPDYINGSPPSAAQHIMYKEPAIAFELVYNGILYNDSCTNIIDVTMQYFWKVNLTSSIVLPSGDAIYPVAGSNMFIIVPMPSTDPPLNPLMGQCSCVNQSANGVCLTGATCQCPCYTALDYDYCTADILTKTFKPCVPPISPLHLSGVTTEAQAEAISLDLPTCKACNVPGVVTSSSASSTASASAATTSATTSTTSTTTSTTAASIAMTSPRPAMALLIIVLFLVDLPQFLHPLFF